MRIVLAGGGTGGHIIPNIALYQELKKEMGEELKVLYIGSKKGLDATLVGANGLEFEGISCGKLRRYFSWENFVDVFRTLWGIWESFWKIKRFKPEVIFCKGGYVSLPVAVAGRIAGVPVILHESDVVPGLANRLASRLASRICVSFAESKGYLKEVVDKVEVTGNPVRAEIAEGNRKRAMELSGLNEEKPVILVMGGSQGAAFVNELIWNNLDNLLAKFQIIHICGAGKVEVEKQGIGYFSLEFANEELKDFYALSDLIITRAGANSLAEIEFLGRPAVLVPLIKGSRGDQIENAEIFAKNNVAKIINEKTFTKPEEKKLPVYLMKLLEKSKNISRKKSSAAEKIAKIIKSYAKKI
ncbi:MAG: undecaprenyldiphospho-muramoylpentapeptide beta-N-acetylglucosaminyltransferase [Candidatus Altimarinota bacterium]